MNAEIINPFLTATINVLETMAFTKAQPGKPAVKEGKISKGDVTGLCGLAGEKQSGSFAISFTESAILAVVSNMFGEKMSEVNDEIRDAVGEITNMISGGARKLLSEKGYPFNMAIPSVIVGKDHEITHKTTGPAIILPFSTEFGDFFVEVALEH